MINFEKTTLTNGLRILTAPMHETKATAVLVLVGTGSRYEADEVGGVSHFLEHMFFKGTKKRPSYLDVSIELDSLGANYNAFTGQEYTGYYVQAASDHFADSLDILADMLLHGTLPEAEIAKEKGVITEELNMYWDIPQSAVAQTVERMLYAPNPLGRLVIGTKETIATTTRERLLNYKDSNYQPQTMVVAVAGNPNRHDWIKSVKSYFSTLKQKSPPKYQKFGPKQTMPQAELIERKTDQAHFVLAWRGIKRTDPQRPALKVMSNIIGGMMSSRLFEEVREKRGLAYYVNSGFDDYHDTGSFYARAGVMTTKIAEAIKVTQDTIEKLKTKPVTLQELKRSKENLKGQLYLGLENSFAVAEFLAEQELLWGYIDQPEKIVEDIEKVSPSDIMELTKEILTPDRLNLAVIGPYEDKSWLDRILGKS